MQVLFTLLFLRCERPRRRANSSASISCIPRWRRLSSLGKLSPKSHMFQVGVEVKRCKTYGVRFGPPVATLQGALVTISEVFKQKNST